MPPAQAYQPWSGLEVRTWSVNDLFPIPFPGGSAQTLTDGSFDITQTPPNPTLGSGAGQPSDIRFSLLVSEGSFPYRPLYRSDLSLSVEAAETTELNVWLLPQSVDVKDGVSAWTVSGVLNNSGLPSNTHITASPSGLAFAGSDSGADVKFGISITPDTSFDLNTFLDLRRAPGISTSAGRLTCAPTPTTSSWRSCEASRMPGASMNTAVLAELENVFADTAQLPLPKVRTFFDTDASLTFMDVTYPTQYTWPLYTFTNTWPPVPVANTTDSTVVVTGDICIGYPRHLSRDPSKLPVLKPVRLSKALRPVLL